MNWAIKYRPESYDQIALAPEVRKLFDEIIKNQHMGDFLFYSPSPGCGKTTLAKLLPELLDLEVLFINASKDGNMDTIRNKIDKFLQYASLGESGKLIILDEAERITQQAQESLRGILEEERMENLHFVFTANNKNRLIDPIANSRLLPLDFSLPKFDMDNKDFISSVLAPLLKYLESILKDNNIEYERKDLLGLVKSEYPGIRRMVVKMEFSIFDNKFIPNLYGTKNILNEDEIINTLKSKQNDLIYKLSENFDDLNFFIDYVNSKLLSLIEIDDIGIAIELFNDYQNNMSNNLMFPKINSLNLLYKLKNINWK